MDIGFRTCGDKEPTSCFPSGHRLSFEDFLFIPRRNAAKSLYKKTATTGGKLIDEMDRIARESFGLNHFSLSLTIRRKSILDDHANVYQDSSDFPWSESLWEFLKHLFFSGAKSRIVSLQHVKITGF